MGGPTRQRIFGYRVRGARNWRTIKRALFAALVVAAPVCLVLAQDAKVSVHMMGIGGMSCAHWRSTQEHLSRLDLRFLDGTQLRCCSKRSNTGENRRGGDSG